MTTKDTSNTASGAGINPQDAPDDAVNPIEFVKAMLHISSEDAAKVRERAAAAMEREDRKRVAEADRGDE